MRGLVQALNPPPSIWHWKLATPVPLPSLPVKLKPAVVLALGLVGLAVIVVFGAVASTIHV